MGRLIFRYNNNKTGYYLINYLRQLLPGFFYRSLLRRKLQLIRKYDRKYVEDRVNYYNKLTGGHMLSDKAVKAGDFRLDPKYKTYSFDTREYLRYFNPELKVRLVFGDITTVPGEPSLLKSRPIEGDNANSVILKLNKVRHYIYIEDKKAYTEKKDMLVFRGTTKQEHRVKFMRMYKNHPMCNVGTFMADNEDNSLYAGWLPKKVQLDYKFILCLEGFDVSSNLKWVMSSNSVAVMPEPKYETWFMEGRLIPDYHYIQIRDDYSDLEERLKYFLTHPDEALQIIKNANKYMSQFRDKKREDLISLMVLEKYFVVTGQSKSL